MDVFLLILAIIFLLVGLIGSLLPVLPGPPIAYIGFFLVELTNFADFSNSFLLIWAAWVIVLAILDYFIPIWGTKKFGGTKAGQKGAFMGTILGIFIPPQPLGLIIGPFIGAFLGELMVDAKNNDKAFRSAIGSFVGFLTGTLLKFVSVAVMIYYFIAEVV